MSSREVLWSKSIVCLIPLCVASEALVLGCGADVADGDPQIQTGGATQSLASGCMNTGAPGDWSNQTFPEQAKRFHAEFDVTPSGNAIDAVVGLSAGGAADFTALAAIVRFNPAGAIDARAGSTYQADLTYPYRAGTEYHIRIDLDVRTHQYSVWVRAPFSSYTAIARSYPFRTEQAAVTGLDNLVTEADSPDGGLAVCGLAVVADATTANGCVIGTAGDGFASVPLPDATVLDTIAFFAQSDTPNIDAVIGLSAGVPAAFSDLAGALRFSPAGTLDVRNGGAYAVDEVHSYGTSNFAFHVIADLTQHTYSVFEGSEAREIARGYAFRTEQHAVTHLDHLGVVVDGTQGHITVCAVLGTPSRGIAYSREGSYAVLPLANDEALLSDGTTTTHVDAAGRAVASVARGGELATDVLGNIFIASVSGNTLSVDKYDPSFTARWHATGTVLAGATISAVSTDPTGAVLIGLVTPQEGTVSIFRFTAGGSLSSQMTGVGNALTLDGDQAIVAWNDGSTLRISKASGTGAPAWNRAYTGNAQITAMAVDPDHNVLFGGALQDPIDFGGGTLPTEFNENGPENAFIVKLSAAGDHVFSQRTDTDTIGGIASNGPRVVVSTTERTQFHREHLLSLDAAGAPAPVYNFDTGFGEHGFADRVAIGATGRVYWNVRVVWPIFGAARYVVVIKE